MEPQWAGENQLEERPLLSKRAEEKLKRRKEIIEQKLHQKRISSTQKKELFTTKVITAQEVINEEHLLEEAGDKGLPVLTKHQKHKKKPRKSDVGSVKSLITSKGNAHISDAGTVID